MDNSDERKVLLDKLGVILVPCESGMKLVMSGRIHVMQAMAPMVLEKRGTIVVATLAEIENNKELHDLVDEGLVDYLINLATSLKKITEERKDSYEQDVDDDTRSAVIKINYKDGEYVLDEESKRKIREENWFGLDRYDGYIYEEEDDYEGCDYAEECDLYSYECESGYCCLEDSEYEGYDDIDYDDIDYDDIDYDD